MDIGFKSRRLQQIFIKPNGLVKSFGARMAKVISARMSLLEDVQNLSLVSYNPPERMHQLVGDRSEQFAINLVHPFRLIFEVNHDPVPRKNDGGIDLANVTRITIIEVTDYH